MHVILLCSTPGRLLKAKTKTGLFFYWPTDARCLIPSIELLLSQIGAVAAPSAVVEEVTLRWLTRPVFAETESEVRLY